MSNYKKLDVWKLSIETVKEAYILTRSYPTDERFGLVTQTNRAAVSIPSNIAEGFGRNYKKDTIQFLYISRGSSYEVETLLNIAFTIKIINEGSYNKVNVILERVPKVINGYINYLEKKL
jgi:four helix bundle protein